jgi:uncharacterized protein (TIGR02246 family)
MAKLVSLGILVGIFGTLHLGCGDEQQYTPDAAAIESLLERQLAAWSAGNGASFAATYTVDADLTTFDGTHVAGRQEIGAFMQAQFDAFLKGTRVSAVPKRIRFIGDSVAVMVTQGGVMFPGETAVPAERFSIQTFLVTKSDAGWLFEAFQNTRIAAPPGGQ